MNQSRYALKVGLFVAAALIVLIALLGVFSKGARVFTKTYEINLHGANLSGLRSGSVVLMAGVPIGAVKEAQLAPDGRGVLIRLSIQSRYSIHADARFVIEQIGFLGDQYVAVYPTENKAPVLKPGDTVQLEDPINMQATVRSATDLIEEAKKTIGSMRPMLERVDRLLLNENTLTNATATVGNFRAASDRVLAMVEGINRLVASNAQPIGLSVSNLVHFSQELDRLAAELTATIVTNRAELTKAVQSLESTSRILERLAYSVEEGRGLAGALIKDPQLKTNMQDAIRHFAILSSNLSRYGLLYRPRQPKTNDTSRAFPGRSPIR